MDTSGHFSKHQTFSLQRDAAIPQMGCIIHHRVGRPSVFFSVQHINTELFHMHCLIQAAIFQVSPYKQLPFHHVIDLIFKKQWLTFVNFKKPMFHFQLTSPYMYTHSAHPVSMYSSISHISTFANQQK